MGSYVPADSADLYCLDGVYTRMGAGDDLAADMSTFMVSQRRVNCEHVKYPQCERDAFDVSDSVTVLSGYLAGNSDDTRAISCILFSLWFPRKNPSSSCTVSGYMPARSGQFECESNLLCFELSRGKNFKCHDRATASLSTNICSVLTFRVAKISRAITVRKPCAGSPNARALPRTTLLTVDNAVTVQNVLLFTWESKKIHVQGVEMINHARDMHLISSTQSAPLTSPHR